MIPVPGTLSRLSRDSTTDQKFGMPPNENLRILPAPSARIGSPDSIKKAASFVPARFLIQVILGDLEAHSCKSLVLLLHSGQTALFPGHGPITSSTFDFLK